MLQDNRWQAAPACLKLYAAGDACSSRYHTMCVGNTPACCHVAAAILHSDAGVAGRACWCLPNFFCSSSMLAAGAAAARRGCRGRTRTAFPPATLRARGRSTANWGGSAVPQPAGDSNTSAGMHDKTHPKAAGLDVLRVADSILICLFATFFREARYGGLVRYGESYGEQRPIIDPQSSSLGLNSVCHFYQTNSSTRPFASCIATSLSCTKCSHHVHPLLLASPSETHPSGPEQSEQNAECCL